MEVQRLQKVSTISERLQIAMDERKIKQIDLARVADVNQGALSRYLKGSYEPKSATIYKLALALGVSDMWLEGYDVPMEGSQKNSEPVNYLYERISHDAKFLTAISQYYNLPVDIQNSIHNLIESVSKNTMGR